jgi:hypothetical protein
LVEVSPKTVKGYLEKALEDPDPSVRRFAKEKLGL